MGRYRHEGEAGLNKVVRDHTGHRRRRARSDRGVARARMTGSHFARPGGGSPAKVRRVLKRLA